MAFLANSFITIFFFTLHSPYFSTPEAPINQAEGINDSIAVVLELSNQNPDSALQLCNRLMQIAVKNDLRDEKAELYRIQGLINYYKVDYVKALEFFILSREIYLLQKNVAGEAKALNNIAVIYMDQGLVLQAIAMDSVILKMRMSISDSAGIAATYNNLAVNYRHLGKKQLALENYSKAIDIANKMSNFKSIGLYYNNIGSIYLDLLRYDSAWFYLNKGLQINEKANDKQLISNSLELIGEYFYNTGNYKEARQYLEQSMHLAQQIGIIYEIESIAESLHQVYYKLNMINEAYNMHLLYKQMADSANNIKTIQKITEIEANTKFEKALEVQHLIEERKQIEHELAVNKQKQIMEFAGVLIAASVIIILLLYRNYRRKSLLNINLIAQRDEIQAQKEEIEAQRNEIETLNQTKDKFFAIIAHDLKNPLSGIYRLTEIMDDNMETIKHEQLKDYVSTLHLTTKKTYELLERLLSWAMIQTGQLKCTPVVFNITQVIKNNIDLLAESASLKNLVVKFETCENCMAYADEQMINTVVQNLLHNAIKFSNNQGIIEFEIRQQDEFWLVSVEDSGVGISAFDQSRIFNPGTQLKNPKFQTESGTGLGLTLCKEFVEMNNGKIGVTSQPNQGSKFYFTVPLAKS